MNPETRTEYIVACIREAGSMYPDDAKAFLAEHDAHRRAEIRRQVLGDDLNPSALVLDAEAYRRLADDIASTMGDPDQWDGDEPEDMILSRYVRWLADGRPPRDDEWDGDTAAQPPAAKTEGPVQYGIRYSTGQTQPVGGDPEYANDLLPTYRQMSGDPGAALVQRTITTTEWTTTDSGGAA